MTDHEAYPGIDFLRVDGLRREALECLMVAMSLGDGVHHVAWASECHDFVTSMDDPVAALECLKLAAGKAQHPIPLAKKYYDFVTRSIKKDARRG